LANTVSSQRAHREIFRHQAAIYSAGLTQVNFRGEYARAAGVKWTANGRAARHLAREAARCQTEIPHRIHQAQAWWMRAFDEEIEMFTQANPGTCRFRLAARTLTAAIRPVLVTGLFASGLLASVDAVPGHKDEYVVAWTRIQGITPVADINATTINGVLPVGFPWSVTDGWAMINLNSGRFRFTVKGLSIGAMPTPLSPIGSTGVVTGLYGTFVCDDGGMVDTDAVELSARGNAFLQGFLPFEFTCDPDGLMLLLRVAEVVPGAPNIVGRWLAFGAVRQVKGPKD